MANSAKSSISTLDLLNSTKSEVESDENESILSTSTPQLNDEKEAAETLDLALVIKPVDNSTTPREQAENDNKPTSEEKENVGSNNNGEEEDVDTSDLDHLEPKLREAWIEMRRLDKRLEAVTKQAKKARLETRTLIEHNKKEWDEFKLTSSHVESKLEAQIETKFYALSYQALNEDFLNEYSKTKQDDDGHHTPVFKTQVPFDDMNESDRNHTKSGSQKSHRTNSNSVMGGGTTTKTESVYSGGKVGKASSTTSSKKEQDSKDFIKRNIELVKDNAGILSLTDDEKKRLDELLSDIIFDSHPNDAVEATSNNQVKACVDDDNKLTYMIEYQPSLVVLDQGDGFTPTREENERLRRIEEQLHHQRRHSRVSSLLSHSTGGQAMAAESDAHSGAVQIKLNDEFDEDAFGDRFIREARMQREEEQRLKYIDSRLKEISTTTLKGIADPSSESISNNDYNNKLSLAEESNVSEAQIKNLIDEYYSEVAESEEMVDKDKLPILSENQLRNLLEELGFDETVSSSRPQSSTTVHSYYEEALKIVSESKAKLDNGEFLAENVDDEDLIVPCEDKQTTKEMAREETPKLLPTIELPPKSSSRPTSSNTTSSRPESSSLIFLPKLDDRFLQN